MSSNHFQGRHRSKQTPNERLTKLGKTVQTDKNRPMLFMGGIPQVVQRTETMLYIEQFGRLVYFDMPTKKMTQVHHGFCKLIFARLRDAEKFLAIPGGHFLGGASVGVSHWVSPDQHTTLRELPAENKLFFKFKTDISADQISTYFQRFGTVNNVEIKQNHVTKQKRDFGFVIFNETTSAQAVLKKGTEHIAGGHKIKVFPSRLTSEVYNPKSTSIHQQKTASQYITPQIASPCTEQKQISAENLEKNKGNMYRAGSNLEVKTTDRIQGSTSVFTSRHKLVSNQPPVSRMQQHPVSWRTELHWVKPSSKLWCHIHINQNHRNSLNLNFNVVVPSTRIQ